MRDENLEPSGYYHVFNRGVDRRQICDDRADFQRLYESMYLFSDSNFQNRRGDFLRKAVELSGHEVLSNERKPHVQILSFCLLSNHFHLFLRQVTDDGVSRFLHKLQMRYSKDYNERHHRTGALFEGAFRVVPVVNEAHFLHLPRYIHLNALDEAWPDWRNGTLNDWPKAKKILDEYPWSSHPFYTGRGQELPLVDEEFAKMSFPNSVAYYRFLQNWAGRAELPIELADNT